MEEFPDYRKNPAQPRVVGMLSAEDMSGPGPTTTGSKG